MWFFGHSTLQLYQIIPLTTIRKSRFYQTKSRMGKLLIYFTNYIFFNIFTVTTFMDRYEMELMDEYLYVVIRAFDTAGLPMNPTDQDKEIAVLPNLISCGKANDEERCEAYGSDAVYLIANGDFSENPVSSTS